MVEISGQNRQPDDRDSKKIKTEPTRPLVDSALEGVLPARPLRHATHPQESVAARAREVDAINRSVESIRPNSIVTLALRWTVGWIVACAKVIAGGFGGNRHGAPNLETVQQLVDSPSSTLNRSTVHFQEITGRLARDSNSQLIDKLKEATCSAFMREPTAVGMVYELPRRDGRAVQESYRRLSQEPVSQEKIKFVTEKLFNFFINRAGTRVFAVTAGKALENPEDLLMSMVVMPRESVNPLKLGSLLKSFYTDCVKPVKERYPGDKKLLAYLNGWLAVHGEWCTRGSHVTYLAASHRADGAKLAGRFFGWVTNGLKEQGHTLFGFCSSIDYFEGGALPFRPELYRKAGFRITVNNRLIGGVPNHRILLRPDG